MTRVIGLMVSMNIARGKKEEKKRKPLFKTKESLVCGYSCVYASKLVCVCLTAGGYQSIYWSPGLTKGVEGGRRPTGISFYLCVLLIVDTVQPVTPRSGCQAFFAMRSQNRLPSSSCFCHIDIFFFLLLQGEKQPKIYSWRQN